MHLISRDCFQCLLARGARQETFLVSLHFYCFPKMRSDKCFAYTRIVTVPCVPVRNVAQRKASQRKSGKGEKKDKRKSGAREDRSGSRGSSSCWSRDMACARRFFFPRRLPCRRPMARRRGSRGRGRRNSRRSRSSTAASIVIPILREAESVQVCTKRSSPAPAPTEGPPRASRASIHKHRDAWREPVPGPTGPRSVGTVRSAS